MRECRFCRYWSEMVAEARGPDILALCLNPESPRHAKWTGSGQGCEKGRDAPYGAIDDPRHPPEAILAAYEKLDAEDEEYGKTGHDA